MIVDRECTSNTQCSLLGHGAVCDASDWSCRFTCKDSSQCRGGVCSFIPNPADLKSSYKVCKAECKESADCDSGNICFGGQ